MIYKQLYFFILLLSSYISADFQEYQNKLDRKAVAYKLSHFLVKDPELKDHFLLTDDAFVLYDQKGQEEARIQLRKKVESAPLPKLSLKKMRIAIDPGHLGGCYAKLEERFIDTGKECFDEGTLTYLTAHHLKELLEKEGATVFLTRDGVERGAYCQNVEEWLKENPQTKSLRDVYNRLDLQARADKINAFKPDLTLIIHYNAEGSGITPHNFNLVFVPGAFKKKELATREDRLNFLRLLFTSNIEKSIQVSHHVIKRMTQELRLPIVLPEEQANYLNGSSSEIEPGVFARNLFLTRNIHSPLCYGESLIQNNAKEITRLSKKDTIINNIPCSSRIKEVALAYFKAICDYTQ